MPKSGPRQMPVLRATERAEAKAKVAARAKAKHQQSKEASCAAMARTRDTPRTDTPLIESPLPNTTDKFESFGASPKLHK